MQLREAGRIAPEDELTKYLPDYPVRGHRVTTHQLLNHTSGIKSYTAMGARWLPTVPLDRTPAEMVDLFKDEPFDFKPDSKFGPRCRAGSRSGACAGARAPTIAGL